MSICSPIRSKRRGVCTGDLDRKITLKGRSMVPVSSVVDLGEEFEEIRRVWASVESTKGRQSWYSTNRDQAISHIFYVRWFEKIESQIWVEYRGENYDVIEVENLDERNEFAALYCNVRGSSSEPVNYA